MKAIYNFAYLLDYSQCRTVADHSVLLQKIKDSQYANGAASDDKIDLKVCTLSHFRNIINILSVVFAKDDSSKKCFLTLENFA